MRKLKLDLNELAVESFRVSPAAHERVGTVHGAMDPSPRTPWTVTLPDSFNPEICTSDSYYGICPATGGGSTC